MIESCGQKRFIADIECAELLCSFFLSSKLGNKSALTDNDKHLYGTSFFKEMKTVFSVSNYFKHKV